MESALFMVPPLDNFCNHLPDKPDKKQHNGENKEWANARIACITSRHQE